uniref:J domain-containing protein n=1 Tax=Rhabditophanes sp. KR3021 TaxID=114890 RepID=A0AC35TVY6_9BILA
MVYAANKEDAKMCVQKARQALRDKDFEKMERLAAKAKRLDHDVDISEFTKVKTDTAQSEETGDYSHHDHYEDVSGLRSRPNKKPSRSKSPHPTKTRSKSRVKDWTDEDVKEVDRIRHCKDYYQILKVTKDADSSKLKKSYRLLALKLHPDKCKAPNATEAFKALGNAYGVLSDTDKRRRYDMVGPEDNSHGTPSRGHNNFYDHDPNRGFDGEFSAEEIFNMFFGGGPFGNNTHVRRNQHFTQRRQYHAHEGGEEHGNLGSLMNLVPLLLFLIITAFLQIYFGQPSFSLERRDPYIYERITRNHQVPYYVKRDFVSQYGGSKLYQVESQVESDFINYLRQECYRENNKVQQMYWRASALRDQEMKKRADNIKMPNCEKLNAMYGTS